MKIAKLNLFCPNCGAREVYVDESDPGDYYAGTTPYCMACHYRLPDLGGVRFVLWESPTMPPDHFAIGRYLEIREAAGLGPEHASETERVREELARAVRMFEERRSAR